MKSVALIEVLCDGNATLGYGHIRRSQTLTAQLVADGFKVRLKGLSVAASRMLLAPRHPGEKPDLILFDSLLDIDAQIREARRHSVPIIALDYFGGESPDINVVVFPHQPPKAKWSDGVRVGFEYVLIRPDVVLEKMKKRSPLISHARSLDVLVCLGGADLLGQSVPSGAKLAALAAGAAKVTVIQGPFAKPQISSEGVEVVVDPPDLPRRFSQCDLAITNGGGCLFEALYFGRPVHVLPQTEAEERVSLALEKLDLLLGRGFDRLGLYNPDQRNSVADRASRGPIDGNGAARISAIVTEALGRG